MRLWIDTEFNDYRGELISIGLVDENDRGFYGSLAVTDPSPWVQDHVMPVLRCQPESVYELQTRLQAFLRSYDTVHLVADWPEDLQHFCWLLISGPGERIITPPLTMEIRRDIDSTESAIPHNAIEDARAIRLAHLALEAA